MQLRLFASSVTVLGTVAVNGAVGLPTSLMYPKANSLSSTAESIAN
jgi:hypothetical protein